MAIFRHAYFVKPDLFFSAIEIFRKRAMFDCGFFCDSVKKMKKQSKKMKFLVNFVKIRFVLLKYQQIDGCPVRKDRVLCIGNF